MYVAPRLAVFPKGLLRGPTGPTHSRASPLDPGGLGPLVSAHARPEAACVPSFQPPPLPSSWPRPRPRWAPGPVPGAVSQMRVLGEAH